MAAPELSTVDEPRQVVNPVRLGRGWAASQVRFFCACGHRESSQLAGCHEWMSGRSGGERDSNTAGKEIGHKGRRALIRHVKEFNSRLMGQYCRR